VCTAGSPSVFDCAEVDHENNDLLASYIKYRGHWTLAVWRQSYEYRFINVPTSAQLSTTTNANMAFPPISLGKVPTRKRARCGQTTARACMHVHNDARFCMFAYGVVIVVDSVYPLDEECQIHCCCSKPIPRSKWRMT
jgi:hypothetical protein